MGILTNVWFWIVVLFIDRVIISTLCSDIAHRKSKPGAELYGGYVYNEKAAMWIGFFLGIVGMLYYIAVPNFNVYEKE